MNGDSSPTHPRLGRAGVTGWAVPKDIYTCPELGRLCVRPGAYDAFDHPSLDASGVRRPYRSIKAEITGP